MRVNSKPLVVDLDGTFVKNDLLHDSLLFVLIRKPGHVASTIRSFFKGKLSLKQHLAQIYIPKNEHVVPNPEVTSFIESAKSQGRQVLLVSASDHLVTSSVGSGFHLFDEVIGSESENLKGHAKARLLTSRFGVKGFDYIGNSKTDLPVWAQADKAHVVSHSNSLLKHAKKVNKNSEVLRTEQANLPILKGMRIHQWIKNLLVFVPLLTAFELFDLSLTSKSIAAFFSFSLLASGVYFINDLSDVNSDREHAKKRFRPIAAGLISVPAAVSIAFLLLSAGLLIAAGINFSFLGIALLYLFLTTGYSFLLKQIAVLDCVILACLYTLRVVAGGLATGIPLTYWLLAFSSFIFFSLAWMKRYAEISNSPGVGKVSGRGYLKTDLNYIFGLGASSAFLSILIFALYIENIQSAGGYKYPDLAWLALPVLTYWLCRIWLIAFRGQMNEDPIIFAAKDKVSIACGLLLAASLAIAHVGIPGLF